MVKWVSLGLTTLVVIVGAIWSFENRYHKIADAKEMNEITVEKITSVKVEVSKEVLGTFQAVQRSFESMQKDNDTNRLEALRDRKYLLEKQFKADPNNDLLKDRVEMLQRQIEKLENKLYD